MGECGWSMYCESLMRLRSHMSALLCAESRGIDEQSWQYFYKKLYDQARLFFVTVYCNLELIVPPKPNTITDPLALTNTGVPVHQPGVDASQSSPRRCRGSRRVYLDEVGLVVVRSRRKLGQAIEARGRHTEIRARHRLHEPHFSPLFCHHTRTSNKALKLVEFCSSS